jgi:L-threonylcarbamoyladenylate synthase
MGDKLVILRPGGVTRERIEEVSGRPVATSADRVVRAPGTLKSHYAPEATVLVVEREELAGLVSALLAAGQRVAVLAPVPVPTLPADAIVLDAPADADAYAHVLYARLRDADRRGVDVVLAVPPPDVGVGAAVGDRLRRAAGREHQ